MRSRSIALLLCIVLMSGSFTGCSSIVHGRIIQPINNMSEVTEDAVEMEILDQTYVDGLNEFTHRMFNELRGDENLFLSPYSISLALSMLYNGAGGTTRAEMAELLGYDELKDYSSEYSEDSNQYMNANARYLMDYLSNVDSKVELNIANSIWLSKEHQLNESAKTSLLTPVRQYYHTDVFQVDFTEDNTLKDVNKWVSNQTKGMIDPFMEQFQNKEMLRVFLVNAIYFNGKWAKPFEPKDTASAPFFGKKSTETVDMMTMYKEEYRYYAEDGIQGIEIPYGNENLVMNVLIPLVSEDNNIGELYQSLSVKQVKSFLEKLDQAKKTEIGTLILPKFEMEYGMKSMNETLEKLGMKDAFLEQANLDLIGDDYYVGFVGHKAKIQVEEWGTKASAATGIEVNTTGTELVQRLNFIVNIPFLFMIRDKQTKVIIFMGQMNQMMN